MNQQTSPEEEKTKAQIAAAFEPPAEGAAVFEHTVDIGEHGAAALRDHSEENQMIGDDARKDNVVVPELPPEGAPLDPPAGFDSSPIADSRIILDAAFSGDYDFAKVTVTEEERGRFYRSGLYDDELMFEAVIPGADVIVEVVMPPMSQTEAALAALDKWGTDGLIGANQVQYLYAFQRMHAWLMVRRINGKPTGWVEAAEEANGGPLSYQKLYEILCDPATTDPLRNMQSARWDIVTLAVRIAERKNTLCVQALKDRKVFTTADSA